MRILDVNGKYVSLNINSKKYVIGRTLRSKLQTLVGQELNTKYPYETILEDFNIPGSKLSVDFFLPRIGLVIEVNGLQHSEYSPFFHGKKTDNKFAQQQVRDSKKENWADINGYKFVAIEIEEDLKEL